MTVQHKRSNIIESTPTSNDLKYGEIAINYGGGVKDYSLKTPTMK